jgi:hypothetical protein
VRTFGLTPALEQSTGQNQKRASFANSQVHGRFQHLPVEGFGAMQEFWIMALG